MEIWDIFLGFSFQIKMHRHFIPQVRGRGLELIREVPLLLVLMTGDYALVLSFFALLGQGYPNSFFFGCPYPSVARSVDAVAE